MDKGGHMKVTVFGAGKAGQFLCEEIMEETRDIEVVAFFDNFLKREYKEKKIYQPDDF